MITILHTNNPVTLDYAQSVLRVSQIDSFIADTHVSILQGSIGAIPRRLMISDEYGYAARWALEQAGLGKEIIKA